MIRAPRTLALLPASLLLASSLWGQKSEGRFWNWFQAHDSALFAVKTGNEPICGELSEELHRTNGDRKSTRLNSSHVRISYAVFCLKKKISTMSISTVANLFIW